ncbi:MAG: iron hydrogenase [Firmicutes bacterium HGW-Firmicutes-14]|nr:MAG: iron hydrogenase [Firmicutes bacterium HGW-Firmicutes-14]
MANIDRRQFLKLCTASAAAVGLSQLWVPAIGEAYRKAAGGNPPIIWIQGSACNGCSTSLVNTVHPDMRELLSEIIDLSFHPGLSSGAGNLFIDGLYRIATENKGKFILVVEGAIPLAHKGALNTIGEDSSGKAVTLIDLLKNISGSARFIIAVGSCASFGGISAAEPNYAECVGLEKFIEVNKVINIPGCPPHPDWIVGTLAHLLLYGPPVLDDYGRPKMFYGGLIHNNCPRRQYFDNSIFAKNFGEDGCLLYLGCKGPLAHGDCPTRLWNSTSSWCVDVNAPCIGCTDPSFPDLTMPFYKRMPEIKGPGITSTADAIGIGLGVATAAGLGAHLAGNYFTGRIGPRKHKEEEDV